MFSRLLVVVTPLTLHFTLGFSVVYRGEFTSAENLPIYQTARRHTSEGISFPLCTLVILIG